MAKNQFLQQQHYRKNKKWTKSDLSLKHEAVNKHVSQVTEDSKMNTFRLDIFRETPVNLSGRP